ncbi:MAG: protein phosphatase 2C domain-containing protein [Chloracidobacterium sp.]|nr:protein phosphatase 2C domain-containing protein [Chloracidobacterium sp.]
MDTSTRILSAAVSDRGLSEKRPQNEDSFLEMNKSGIFAVADGVGGAQAGEVASQMAMEILGEAFINLPTGADAETVMRTAIERANTAIHQMAHELPQLATMATTIVALHIDGSVATIGHVGDSRLYRVDREGDLYRETDDHSVVADEVRAGRMTEEQAENHPSRNVISRALGAEATVDVEIKTIMIEPGTSFLICSDGITRHIADAEIKGVLTFGGDPVDICEYLKGLCYERGAEDNLTAVVVKVSATPAATVDADAETIQFTAPLAIEEDEPTVASARPAFDVVEDEPELLELETRELVTSEVPDVASAIEEKLSEPLPEQEITPEPAVETTPEPTPEPAPAVPSMPAEQPFSMFGGEAEPSETEEKSGSLGRIATAVVMLVIGSAIGLGVYHFALAPKAADTPLPQLSEMQSSNQPQTAFEENRRNVDKDPAGALARFGADPRDAEDYFLVGRANMLLGKYPEARKAFTETRSRIAAGDVDPSNAKTIETEIAIALAVTSDTTIQSILKKELDGVKNPANTNANTNANK